ncbi:MAG: TetR/AcrR family transcriptional regulator [Actinomycetia bacterium]|nr:TetR/AcrR family transcriptional regulator [Actinomycetes bacterium]
MRTRHETASAGKAPRIRLSSPERQAQIADAALRLIASHGLQEATVSRIAQEVGMEAPSLYAHFPSRQDMLLAAVNALFERVSRHLSLWSEAQDALEGLRILGETHATFITNEFYGFVIPIFEFMTAPRDSGLSEAVGRRQRDTLDTLVAYVEEGKRQGVIRKDTDSRTAAYEMMLLFWAEDVTQLMGIDEFVSEGISRKILDLFLRDMEDSERSTSCAESSTEATLRPAATVLGNAETLREGKL